MALFPILVCSMIAFFLDFTQADPEFPTFPDDYAAMGTIRMKGMVTRFRILYSKSLKSLKFEAKSYGEKVTRYTLENAGAYGTEVSIETHPGERECTIVEGTAKSPVKCESLLSAFLKQPKYVGIVHINGEEMKKWQFSDKDLTGFIIIREDKNGPAPYSAQITGRGIVTFDSFSSASPTRSDFKYSKEGCKRRGRHGSFRAFQNFLEESSFLLREISP